MHETLFAARFEKILENITPQEFDALRKVATSVVNFSETNFGRKIAPRGALVQSLNVLRHVKFIYGSEKPRVFEYGPGCGYLGALLYNEGYPYAAMDIAQALYLYQNHMWCHVTKGNVIDGANRSGALEALYHFDASKLVHLPWWDYYQMDLIEAPRFDIVTINHAICEMHDSALRLALLHIKSMLRGRPDEKKLLMFEGWGQSDSGRRAQVNTRLHQYGFRMVHHDLKITAFALQESDLAINHAKFPEMHDVAQPMITADGRLQMSSNQHASWVPTFFTSEQNQLSRKIIEERKFFNPSKTVNLSEVDAMYSALLGTNDYRTADEKFMALIGLQGIVCNENGDYL
jgi:hypothetical protein